VAHIEKSIEVRQPVGDVYRQWTELEEFPRFLGGLREVGVAETRLRWRAEVLTFAPRGTGTRVTLRIDYDAMGSKADRALRLVSWRLQRDLELFKTTVEMEGAAGAALRVALAGNEPSHA
jgi:uncharacterized membrane protein